MLFNKELNKRKWKKYNQATRKYTLICMLLGLLAQIGLSVFLTLDLNDEYYNDLSYGLCSTCLNLTGSEIYFNYTYPKLDRKVNESEVLY